MLSIVLRCSPPPVIDIIGNNFWFWRADWMLMSSLACAYSYTSFVRSFVHSFIHWATYAVKCNRRNICSKSQVAGWGVVMWVKGGIGKKMKIFSFQNYYVHHLIIIKFNLFASAIPRSDGECTEWVVESFPHFLLLVCVRLNRKFSFYFPILISFNSNQHFIAQCRNFSSIWPKYLAFFHFPFPIPFR